MKKTFRQTALAAVLLAALCACNKEEIIYCPDGLWDPIETDRNGISLPSSGGTDTFHLKNYSMWWLSEVDARENDTTIHYYRDLCHDNDTADWTAQGKWFNLWIPNENRRLLIVHCTPNTNNDYRTLSIFVTVGDSFKTLQASQETSKRPASSASL